MKLFIDCEFNGFDGELISTALVSENDDEFYEVLHLPNNACYDEWVSYNVVPYLNKQPILYSQFQEKLREFINRWPSIEVIADWPDDIKYFCYSLITGPGKAMATPLDLTLRIDRELSSARSAIPHNALEDAKAIKRHWYAREAEAANFGVCK
jgi:hypothetical protein